MKYSAIIPAAGTGSRSGLDYNKILYPMQGNRIIDQAISCFMQDPDCQEILIMYNPDDYENLKYLETGKARLIQGGKDRAHSVFNGLMQAQSPFVFIHDGARPFLKDGLLLSIKEALENHDGIFPAIPVRDSLKKVINGKIKSVNREEYLRSQTPQAFKKDLLINAYEKVFNENLQVSDDAQVFELAGFNLNYVPGDPGNIKITDPEDLKNNT